LLEQFARTRCTRETRNDFDETILPGNIRKESTKCSVLERHFRDLRDIARNFNPKSQKEIGMQTMKLVSAHVVRGILAALIVAGCVTITANAQTVNGNGTGTNSGY
jgi:hypothetical protein